MHTKTKRKLFFQYAVVLLLLAAVAFAGVFFHDFSFTAPSTVGTEKTIPSVGKKSKKPAVSQKLRKKKAPKKAPSKKPSAAPRDTPRPSAPPQNFPQPAPGSMEQELNPAPAEERTYAKKITNKDPIVLSGNQTLLIEDTHYIHGNNIELKDSAQLIIRRSLFEHQKDHAFEFSLKATGSSRVTVEDSTIGNSCNGSFNWEFHDYATLTTNNVKQKDCNVWNVFSEDAKAFIKRHPFNGTFCDRSIGTIEKGEEMEMELCIPNGAIMDESLPKKISSLSFPNENDVGVSFRLTIKDSTVDGWGIGLVPQSKITLRNSEAVTVALMVGTPWNNLTAEVSGLEKKTYKDQTWQIGDSVLYFENVGVYGWEPNVFSNNTLIIRDSDYTSSSVNSGTAKYVIEKSTAEFLRAAEDVEMTVRDSVIKGDVIAVDNAKITLINTKVGGKLIQEGNGKIEARP